MEPENVTSGSQSALLSFTAENARSYLNEVHLSLLAGRRSADSPARPLATAGQPVRVLPAAGIFGANGSGKSTLLKAMADLRRLVLESLRPGNRPDRSVLAVGSLHQPFEVVPRPQDLERMTPEELERFRQLVRSTRYRIDLLVDGVRWEYGLDVNPFIVESEHAYHYPHGRQALVFRREHVADGSELRSSDIVFGASFRSSGQHLVPFVQRNVLLLSAAAVGGFEPLGPLVGWFQENLELSEPEDRRRRSVRAVELVEEDRTRDQVMALLRAADLGLVAAARDPVDPEFQEIARRARRVWAGIDDELDADGGEDSPLDDSIRLTHRGPWGDATLSRIDESMGTLTWVGLIGPVLDALRKGSVLLVDELDSSLHPYLVRDVVRLFQDPRTNPNMAQLIFNAHDVTLLGDSADRSLGRDQVWITEKTRDGVTTATPLSDYRPRYDEAIERRYMQGRYGGVPTINPAEYARATEQIGA
ncbi:MAG: AAA family ATPase [bacterium]|nr:AAA family ATPase [bacterium]MCY3925983.1 AAA family ATPase [bacterium]